MASPNKDAELLAKLDAIMQALAALATQQEELRRLLLDIQATAQNAESGA